MDAWTDEEVARWMAAQKIGPDRARRLGASPEVVALLESMGR